MTHPAALSDRALLTECAVRRTRRSGPGGQHRNKVETAVVLEHLPTQVRAEAAERRSQSANQREALRRLRVNLALAIRETVRPQAVPSRLWQARCPHTRLRVAVDHADFPVLLAEALDRIEVLSGDVKAAAAALGCTTSQLLRLLRLDPRALARVNSLREANDQRPLR